MLNITPDFYDTIDILYLNYQSSARKLLVSKDILAVQDSTYSDLWNTVVNSQGYSIRDWNKFITEILNEK
jgi:hypothetical protein